jgi:RNA-directed DNA polymerase
MTWPGSPGFLFLSRGLEPPAVPRRPMMIASDLYSFRELWQHYRNCRRNKRNTANALAFEVNAEANLMALQSQLREHSYQPGRSICFVTKGAKPREVFAADFRDRIVHHLLVWHLEHIFEPRFIHDSYACRRGKGTLAASDRLTQFLGRVTANGRRRAWALKLDVASFFPSVDKETLFQIIAQHAHHPEILWLTRTVLFHDPTSNYTFQPRKRGVSGPSGASYPVPPCKSLFGNGNARGLPIGNLTSQFWGNVYLNELDQFVKRILRCRHYLRYVDDMVLLHHSRAQLCQWREAIERYLWERLRLALRPEPAGPFPVQRGIDFVGWRTWWNRRLLRRRTLGNLRGRLRAFERSAIRRGLQGRAQRIALDHRFGAGSIARLQTVLASYAGHLQHGAARREWVALWKDFPWLGTVFEVHEWAVAARFSARPIVRARHFQQQYWALVSRAGSICLVFCRVGRFVEFRGIQRGLAERTLGLRTACCPRAGFALVAGFPIHLVPCYRWRAIRKGCAVVEVREGIENVNGCRLRVPEVLWRPM